MSDPEAVLSFWFDELTPPQWFEKNLEMDAQISDRFADVHALAITGALKPWRETAQGRLAEVIVLDQFSRNMFRDTPGSFASDGLALQRSREAIDAGADQEVDGPDSGPNGAGDVDARRGRVPIEYPLGCRTIHPKCRYTSLQLFKYLGHRLLGGTR